MTAIDVYMDIEVIHHMIGIIEKWNFDSIPDPFNKTCRSIYKVSATFNTYSLT